jgi:glyoxylase-like metal-dependent hydrolase (beta-lactamase superfamily II)
MKTYLIRPLPLTNIELDLAAFTYRYNYGIKKVVPLYAWYIEGADKRILVDTAADAKFATEFRGFRAEEVSSFEDALAGLGLKPHDIEIVVQTHLQWDHCANTHKCENAKIVVQEEELKFALAPHPILAPTYQRSLLKDLNFMPVRGHFEIAPGIELIPAPGHTPGTQAVSILTERGRAIITGFCCVNENFKPPEEIREILPVLPPGVHLNAVDAFDSALFIKGLADILIPIHEPSFANLKRIPS